MIFKLIKSFLISSFIEHLTGIYYISTMCLVAQSCPISCDSVDCSLPGSSVHGDSPGKNTVVGCHVFLQGIFPTQRSNPGLLHCRQIRYCLRHQGSPYYVCVSICIYTLICYEAYIIT